MASSWKESTFPDNGRVVNQVPFRHQYTLDARKDMYKKEFGAQEKRSEAMPDAVWRLPLVIEPHSRHKLPYAATRVRYTLKETMEMRRLVHHIATKMAFVRDPERQQEGRAGGVMKPRESIFCFVEYQRDDPVAVATAKAKGIDPPEPKVQTVLLPTNQTMADIYRNYADRDGFLYIVYDTENVFGSEAWPPS